MKLYLDFETRSFVDLTEVGSYAYAEHPSTQAILLAWAIDDNPVEIWECLRYPMPEELKKLLLDKEVKKYAWNVTFEYNIFKHVLKMPIPIEEWCDVMVRARYLSLSGGLEECGRILNLSVAEAKLDGSLKNRFCAPYTMGGEQTLFGVTTPDFYDWNSHPEDWKRFIEYCKRDVIAERKIAQLTDDFSLPQIEERAWRLDQKINEAGLPINLSFVENALALAEKSRADLMDRLKVKTGLQNPNSRNQLLPWLKEQGYIYESIRKDFVRKALTSDELSSLGKEVLQLREAASHTSYKKLEAIKQYLSSDHRLKGQYLFLGASRTGRWSGVGAQFQNTPRPAKEVEKKYDRALELISKGDYEGIISEFGSVLKVVASCIRSACQAPDGYSICVCDFSAIENRGLGWIAKCDAMLDVFRKNQDPYIAFATKMYNKSYEELKNDKEKRQIAKPAVLGAGYGLGPGVKKISDRNYEVLYSTDSYGNTVKTGLLGYAENMGIVLSAQQAYTAWQTFRNSYPEVVKFWGDIEKAVIKVIKSKRPETLGLLSIDIRDINKYSTVLRIKLPSGRYLHYLNPQIEERETTTRSGDTVLKDGIIYEGIGHGVGKIQNGWGMVYTYGGKLTENIVQAICRDLLVHALFLASDLGFEIIGHTHDEIITLNPNDDWGLSLADLKQCMSTPPDWAKDFPLSAEGYCDKVYKK